jgi:hypothetical protein
MNRLSGFSRREFLYAGSLTLLLSGCKRKKHTVSSTQPQDTKPTAAVSLAALQEHAKHKIKWPGSGNGTLPGANRITGFMAEGADVILYGRQDDSVPAIELDALVVALRNAYGAGEAYQGDPGCTIDPIPGEDPFRIQKVKVFGVPQDCVMAARHVNLDYELKRAGAGIQSADGKILPSAFELENDDGPCASTGKKAVDMAHRYWYFPRTPERPRFQRDGQTASILRPIGVQLLTEQEFLNSRGERTGAAEADPAAQKFADAVTALLDSDKVARFAQMVHDFRVIELARLMRFGGVTQEVLSFLLTQYELQHVQVPTLVGGVKREEQGSTVCKTTVNETASEISSEESISEYHYEYRGGVQAKVELAEADFVNGDLGPIRKQVLNARPSADAVSWVMA